MLNVLLIDPGNTDKHIYTNVLWLKWLIQLNIAPLPLLACNTRNKAGLPTISFTFRSYRIWKYVCKAPIWRKGNTASYGVYLDIILF